MSNQFKIKLKLELEVEGTRDDIPLITQAVTNQMSGLLSPATDIVEGDIVESYSQKPSIPEISSPPLKKRPNSKRNKSKPAAVTDEDTANLPSWTHDVNKWGNPKQDWSTSKKAIWLLFVIAQETDTHELRAGQIESIFNSRFKQSKMIEASNVSRDLGRLAKMELAAIGKDTNNSPLTWYLTQEGQKQANALVLEALGQTSGSDSGANS